MYIPVFRLHIGNIAWPMKLGSPNMSSSLTTNLRYAKGGLMTSTSNVTHHTGFKPLSAETTKTTTSCQLFVICSEHHAPHDQSNTQYSSFARYELFC